MRKIWALALTLITVTALGQSFEGKIEYENSYISKVQNVTSEQFTSMMGSTQTYLIKDGNYKSTANGTLFQWQLYINKENRLYTKMSNAETILWNDCAINTDEVLKVEINKSVIDILSYKCDEIILTCKTGVQKYYFNSKIGVDPTLFSKHLFANWFDYIKVAKALPLKMVVDNAQFTMTSIATSVKEMKPDSKEFQLPENAKTAKSPY
jgi:hypothetical protein